MAWTTVCSVYSGLVPRSPKTTPSEASLTHVARFLAVAGIELLVVTDPVFTAIPNSSQRRGEEQFEIGRASCRERVLLGV
jgi:hypothetical protein